MGNPSKRFVLVDRTGVKRNHMSESHEEKRKLLFYNNLQLFCRTQKVHQTQCDSIDGVAQQYCDTKCRRA